MTIRFDRIKLRNRLAYLCAALAGIMSLASCNSMIYDEEGDCDPHYKVRFVYDHNMKFADAFHNEVKDVTLYVVDDNTGRVVYTKHESGEALSQQGYMMDIEVAPGDYSLLAWCGEGHRSSFGVNESTVHTEIGCSLLDRVAPQEGPWGTDGSHVRNYLENLYHGRLQRQNFPDDEGTYVYTVPLIKNTNNIHIVLQHLSGDPVDKDAFTFTITDENGEMQWDNELLPDEKLTYFAWHKTSGIAGIEVPDYTRPEDEDDNGRETQGSRAIVQTSACVAEISVGRLMESHHSKYMGQNPTAFVNIYNSDGEQVVRIPLIDCLLLYKSHNLRGMSDQEFLDRQDDYSMVFFLDEDNRWITSRIFINSWLLVEQPDIEI